MAIHALCVRARCSCTVFMRSSPVQFFVHGNSARRVCAVFICMMLNSAQYMSAVFISDSYAQYSFLIFMYNILAPYLCAIFICDIYAWYSWMIFLYDILAPYSCVIFICNIYAQYSWIIFIYNIRASSSCAIFMRDKVMPNIYARYSHFRLFTIRCSNDGPLNWLDNFYLYLWLNNTRRRWPSGYGVLRIRVSWIWFQARKPLRYRSMRKAVKRIGVTGSYHEHDILSQLVTERASDHKISAPVSSAVCVFVGTRILT